MDEIKQEQNELEASEQIIKEKLSDRWWRLNNLYYIKDEKGQRVLFKPEQREAQQILYENLWYFSIVPKARQLGITTFFSILYLDQVLFSSYKNAVIIAHTEKDMKKIFRNKIKFAWENLHPWLKNKIGEPNTDNANELIFPNGSQISVALSSRSDTVNFLHISEFAKICAKYPDKAEEIVTGAINSVHAGNFVSIESTSEGPEGYFYDFVMEAERNQKMKKTLTEMEFKLFFFPWYMNPSYVIHEGDVVIDTKLQEYFSLLEKKDNIYLTPGQKRWYAVKKKLMGGKMFNEFPTTLHECFSASVEGQVYGEEMRDVYESNRIRPLPYDAKYEVDTWWDLGWSDYTSILFTQTIGGQIRFIDHISENKKPLTYYYDLLKERKEKLGYRYGAHHLPHDAEVSDLNRGQSRKEMLYGLGLYNIKVGKRLDITEGIEGVKRLFNRFYFDEEKCQGLVTSIFNYKYEWDHKLGIFKKAPKHDKSSHDTDPLRLLPQFWKERLIMSDYDRELAEEQDRKADTSFFG